MELDELYQMLDAADAAGDTAGAADIMAQIEALEAGGGGPPAAPPAPGGGPAAPGTPAGQPGATPIATPPVIAPGGPPAAAATPNYKTDEQGRVVEVDIGGSAPIDPTTGMSFGELALAGAGQSVASTGRGIQQLWNWATRDKEDLARLQKEEEESRRLDAPLLATAGGRIGQVGGHILQSIIPAAGVAKGAKALQALAPFLKGGALRSLATVSAAEGVGGGVMGALEPTIKGEHRSANVVRNAVLSAAFPGAQQYLKKAGKLPLSVTSAMLGKMVPKQITAIGHLAARKLKESPEELKGVRKKVWDEMKEIVHSSPGLGYGDDIHQQMKKIRRDFGKSMGEWADDRLKRIIKESGPAKVSAAKVKALKEAKPVTAAVPKVVKPKEAKAAAAKPAKPPKAEKVFDAEGNEVLFKAGEAKPVVSTSTARAKALANQKAGLLSKKVPSQKAMKTAEQTQTSKTKAIAEKIAAERAAKREAAKLTKAGKEELAKKVVPKTSKSAKVKALKEPKAPKKLKDGTPLDTGTGKVTPSSEAPISPTPLKNLKPATKKAAPPAKSKYPPQDPNAPHQGPRGGMSGEDVQKLYAGLGAEAAEKGGAGAHGMADMRKVLDEHFFPTIGKANERQLLHLRELYEAGRSPVNMQSRGRPITGSIVRSLRSMLPGHHESSEEKLKRHKEEREKEKRNAP